MSEKEAEAWSTFTLEDVNSFFVQCGVPRLPTSYWEALDKTIATKVFRPIPLAVHVAALREPSRGLVAPMPPLVVEEAEEEAATEEAEAAVPGVPKRRQRGGRRGRPKGPMAHGPMAKSLLSKPAKGVRRNDKKASFKYWHNQATYWKHRALRERAENVRMRLEKAQRAFVRSAKRKRLREGGKRKLSVRGGIRAGFLRNDGCGGIDNLIRNKEGELPVSRQTIAQWEIAAGAAIIVMSQAWYGRHYIILEHCLI